jgi:hypothetical protein
VRINVQHGPNLEDVWAAFVRREAPRTTITLMGSVDESEEMWGRETLALLISE